MSNLKARLTEVLAMDKMSRTPRAPEDTNTGNTYYYDVLRYQSTKTAKSKSESVFDAQNTQLLGIPHQFLDTADFRIDEKNYFGYCFAKDIFMERPVVTFMPGKVNYLPDYSKQDKKIFGSLSADMNNENSKNALKDLMDENAESRYYDFASDYSTYIRYVNLMCRVAATYLGIEKRIGPDGKTPYAMYDWANYQLLNNYETPVKDNTGILSAIEDLGSYLTEKLGQLSSDVIAGQRNFVHFYVDPSTSINETMSNGTQKSQLEGAFDSMEGIVKEASMLLSSISGAGEQVGQFVTSAGEGIISLVDTVSLGLFKNMLGLAEKEVLHGANIIYPEIWMDTDYSKSYTVQLNLVSPYGEKEAVYLNIMVPLLHALALSLPRQTSANSYTMPFIIRAFAKGWFSCDMGIVESISIDKGPEQSWSIEGLPTQVKITMTVKDLYSQLMMSPSNKPNLFFTNQGMMDYLGSLCGVDLTVPNIVFKAASIKALLAGINDIPSNIYRDLTESLYRKIQGILR